MHAEKKYIAGYLDLSIKITSVGVLEPYPGINTPEINIKLF
jgi:hypothetical protein